MEIPRNTAVTALALGALALSSVAAAPAARAQDAAGDVHLAAVEVPTGAAAADTAHENLVQVAAAAGQFETLLKAARAAGLAETLAGDGPFTVFAPTDEAFAALPDGTLEELLNSPEKLRGVLTYHVVPGEVTAGQVVGMSSAETVNGARLQIDATDGTVRIDDARVVTADVQASNGVIHVIDAVLLPPEK